MDFALLLVSAAVGVALLGIILAATSICIRSANKVRHAHRLADELTELQDSVNALRMLVKRVNAREAKRDTRGKIAADAPGELEEPDWRTDPEGWKTWKQKQLDAARRH